jgi:hypothetical protein
MYGLDGRQERYAISLRALAGAFSCFDNPWGDLPYRPAICERQALEKCGGGVAGKFGSMLIFVHLRCRYIFVVVSDRLVPASLQLESFAGPRQARVFAVTTDRC